MAVPCPNCREQILRPILLQPGLPANACPECSGVQLSLVAWRSWREENPYHAAGPAERSGPDEVSDNRSALRCPKCTGIMTKYRIVADTRNQIDYCAHCEEIWLDRGEWALLARFEVSDQLTKVFTQPWQARVRSQDAKKRQEDRFREQFGDDYDKAKDVRDWLAEHPKGKELLAYLYLSQTHHR